VATVSSLIDKETRTCILKTINAFFLFFERKAKACLNSLNKREDLSFDTTPHQQAKELISRQNKTQIFSTRQNPRASFGLDLLVNNARHGAFFLENPYVPLIPKFTERRQRRSSK
jgi:hypothetical protein